LSKSRMPSNPNPELYHHGRGWSYSVPNKWRWKLSYVGCPNVPHFLLRLAQSDVSLRSPTHHCRKGALWSSNQ
jgi:hypothetical protein